MATGHESNQQPGTTTQGAGGGGKTAPEWDALKGDVGEMAGAAMEQGREFLDSARDQATGYVDERKNDAAQSVVGLADMLRDSGGAFENQPGIRAIVDSAAGGLETLADNIRGRSVGDMFGDVEEMVRRRPAMAAVATMAAGFLVARFVKASAEGFRNAGQRRGQPAAATGQSHGMAGTGTAMSGQPRS